LARRKNKKSNGRKSSLSRWILVFVLLAVIGGAGYFWWRNGVPSKWRDLIVWRNWLPKRGRTAKSVPPPAAARTNGVPLKTNIAPELSNIPPKVKTDLTIHTNPVIVETNLPPEPAETEAIHPARTVLEAQIALARLGISVGCIDGSKGSQTRSGLQAFQTRERSLSISGDLDAETKERLRVQEPLFEDYTVTGEDLARLHPVSETWLGKSEQERLEYESLLELIAEKGQASQTFIRNLNPGVSWGKVGIGTVVKIPRIERPAPERAAFVRIDLLHKTIEAFDSRTNLLAHFPCSIAQKVEKRPVGTLYVAKLARNPNYVMDPAVFPESEEAQKVGRKLVIPPGPNNPVGTAWIGLDKTGYGIHGTPKPEQVGRTESHGCFRLANWNAEYLFDMVWIGMPVYVER
jgi:lipoprotein-anchoring transpeptidase ErfK/SrfK